MQIARNLSDRELKRIDPDNRTLRQEFNGSVLWVKYASVHRRPFSSTTFNAIATFTGVKFFASTHNPDPFDALDVEAKRLDELMKAGFSVPRVMEKTRDHMVLTDIGQNLERMLEEESSPHARRALIAKSTTFLADLHRNGEYHGRSVTKDLMIAADGKAGMVDLEHQPLKVMSLAEAQCRDIWLLFTSAAKYRLEDPSLFHDMADLYAITAPKAAIDALSSNVRNVARMTAFIRPALNAILEGNVVKHALDMNRSLNCHLNG